MKGPGGLGKRSATLFNISARRCGVPSCCMCGASNVGNTRATEHLLRCPRYALRTAGRAAAPLLPTLAQARRGSMSCARTC